MKVLLLDDHPLVRSALESVISSLGREVAVTSAATAAESRTFLAGAGPFDLALIDLQLPDGDGFSLLTEWRRGYPDMPVVVISASEHPADVMRALDEGALGFIPKRTANEVLMHALRMVMSGGIYVPPMALQMGRQSTTDRIGVVHAHEPVLGRMDRFADILNGLEPQVHAHALGHAQAAGTEPDGSPPGRRGVSADTVAALRLTPRQSEVLELLLQGQPNKLIARQLNLSVETVKDHVASLLRVLGVSSRTQAVLAVSRMMAGAGQLPSLVPRPSTGQTVHIAR